VKEKPTVGSLFFRSFLSDRRMMSLYISLFTVAIPVNYTKEFREIFEVTSYDALLQDKRTYFQHLL
jgi:hypothetical protein